MSFKEDDYEILLHFNFHILLVDVILTLINYTKLRALLVLISPKKVDSRYKPKKIPLCIHAHLVLVGN